jgi:hypothetical protein
MTDILETGLEFFPEHLSKTNLDIHDEFGGLLMCGETMEHLLELCDNKTGVAKIELDLNRWVVTKVEFNDGEQRELEFEGEYRWKKK